MRWHIFNFQKDTRVYEVTALAGHQSTCCNNFSKKNYFLFGRLWKASRLLNSKDKWRERGMLLQAMKTIIHAGKPVPYIIHKNYPPYNRLNHLISLSKDITVLNCNRGVAFYACNNKKTFHAGFIFCVIGSLPVDT